MITSAESRTLRLLARHGKAIRHPGKASASEWTWRIDGNPYSRTVDSLILKGCLQLSGDKQSALMTARGWNALSWRDAA